MFSLWTVCKHLIVCLGDMHKVVQEMRSIEVPEKTVGLVMMTMENPKAKMYTAERAINNIVKRRNVRQGGAGVTTLP